ncbi:MAG: hypothetical protein FWG39_00370 [Alphaproteobacteria bacterium]|nr:hypothetical protein [Alphaproteobacteria bacterium]
MTETEKDEIITRAVSYIIKNKKIRDDIWRLLAEEMFRIMVKIDALEKKAELKEIDDKINARKHQKSC